MADSYLERQFVRMTEIYKIPAPVREYKFMSFRFDFAWPQILVCVEIDGATFAGGNHVRGVAYQRDCVKNNLAQLNGWVVLRADSQMVNEYDFYDILNRVIKRRLAKLLINNRRKSDERSEG